MSIEQNISQELNKHPAIKKGVKRVYQRAMYAISPKIKSEGNITRLSPNDPKHEYFFGYYDKSPWDATGRYVLCLKAKDTWSRVASDEPANILLIDTALPETDTNRYREITSTHTWNVQQGCMMQWLGPDYDKEIIYNDCRDGKYCSIIRDVFTGEERLINSPVYSVSPDGVFALTLDFSRLHRLRPGYGYSNIADWTEGVLIPDEPCIWKIDLKNNITTPLLSYADFACLNPRLEMKGAEHKVNHIMLSPNGKRFMVLHRWLQGSRKYSRLITCNADGSDMYILSDDDMVSHCCWKNENVILAFENKKDGGIGYYLMKDKTQKYKHLWKDISTDGHPSFSPDGKSIVMDTYPNRSRIQTIRVMNGVARVSVAKVFSPFKYDNDTRCDLHPRWSRDGKKICFDGTFEGYRGLYSVDVSMVNLISVENLRIEKMNNKKILPDISVIIPCYNSSLTICNALKSLENQKYQNFEVIIIDDGSIDDTQNIIKEYAGNSKLKIRYFKQKNGGVSSARNFGIQMAIGKYLAFLDADDYYRDNFLITLLDSIEKYDCDFSLCRYELTDDYSKLSQISRDNLITNIISKYDAFDIYNNHRVEKVNFVCCLYKSQIIKENQVKFPLRVSRGEDTKFFLTYLFYCKNKGVMVCSSLYGYVMRKDSVTHINCNNQVSVVESLKDAIKLWNSDPEFDRERGKIALARTFWAVSKNLAISDEQLYRNFIAKNNVNYAMRLMSKNSVEKVVSVSSKLFLVSPTLFRMCVAGYTRAEKIKNRLVKFRIR